MRVIIQFIFSIFFLLSCSERMCPDDSPNFVAVSNTFFYHDSSMVFRYYGDDPIYKKYIKDSISIFKLKNWNPKFQIGFIEGDFTIFEYYHKNLGCEKYVDDEYESQVCIQIPRGKINFIINDKELNKYCFFNESYFGCPECCFQKMEFVKGKINGKKDRNNDWMIKAKIYYSCIDSMNNYGDLVKIEFSGKFIKHEKIPCTNYLRRN